MAPASPDSADDALGDAQLALLAAQDDAAAFERLVRRWGDPLFQFLLGRLANRADAQDALQDAFAAAWRYRASYQQRFAYSTWLYRIAIREAARARRRQARLLVDEPVAEPAQEPGQPRVWALARKHLSAQAFTVLWLRYHEDWTVKEIGRCLRRPAAWVRLSLHRSRKRLAIALQDPE